MSLLWRLSHIVRRSKSISGQRTHPAVCWRLTPSSHDLNRPEAKRFRVKLTNFDIAKIDLVEVFIDLLEAKSFKSKDLADE